MLSRSSLFSLLTSAFGLPQMPDPVGTVVDTVFNCGGKTEAFHKAQCWRDDHPDAVWVGNLDSMPYHCDHDGTGMNVDNWRDGSKCNGQFPACEGRCFMKNE